MRRFWGLLLSYWLSERWVEAWTLTIGVAILTTLLSKSSVWAATSSADFLTALVRFHSPAEGTDPIVVLITAVSAFAAIHLGRVLGIGVRHLCSSTLHRKARGWTQAQFSAAMLSQNHIAASLMSDRDTGPNAALPDNIDQRVDECSESLFAGLIGLAMGIWGSVASIYFISIAVLERSSEVDFLERWAGQASQFIASETGVIVNLAPGEYGTALLVLVLIVVYVPIGTICAWRIGRVLERQTLARQASDGTWRGELTTLLNRSSQIAASEGERAQVRVNQRLYAAIDRNWHRLNITTVHFQLFSRAYVFLSNRLVGYLPGLPGFISGSIGFRAYSATSELVAELINDCSWFIHVMPAIATLRANAQRLNQVAEAIEQAHDRAGFYGRTGIHAFKYTTQEPRFGLSLRDVELRHRGHDAEPFLTLKPLSFAQGSWSYVAGQNGCGKSSLMKAIAGLWPYGGGTIAHPEGARRFFAGQDPDLPDRLTLRELVCYPHDADAFSDLQVAAALGQVGLGKFLGELDSELYRGKSWQSLFSGGQRQRLVLARIIVQKPDVLLLDEACSALDRDGVIDFHRLIQESCPRAIVISIMHEPEPPVWPDGTPFYDQVLRIEDGQATLDRLGSELAARHGIAAE